MRNSPIWTALVVLVVVAVFAAKSPLSFGADRRSEGGRVWQVTDPLYDELLTGPPMGLNKEGSLYWPHYLMSPLMRDLCLRYATPYSCEKAYATCAAHRMMPLLLREFWDDPRYDTEPSLKRYGVKALFYPYLGETRYQMDTNFVPFVLVDTDQRKEYMAQLEDYTKRYKDVLWGVYTYDELESWTMKVLTEKFWRHQADYPLILEIDRQIREKYGFGKYGIPSSENDLDPFRWRAMNAWIADAIIDFTSEVYDLVKSIDPTLKVVSIDPTTRAHSVYDRARWKCDVLTVQTLVAQDGSQARTGYQTKMAVDLSNHKEVWPCVHVERFAMSFTPAETLEELSQVFRNGGTGWHIYPTDVIGRWHGTGAEKRTLCADEPMAPDRWKTVYAVIDESRKMGRLPRLPQPDFAVLFSADAYASFPGRHARDSEIGFAYTILGPLTRGWFKFIEDLHVDRGEVDLKQYKAIYIPLGNIVRESVASALADYVKSGGILVSGDPQVFSFGIDGSDISKLRRELFGLTLGGQREAKSIKYNDLDLPIHSNAFDITPSADCSVLARYPDGKPSVVSRRFGGGRTVYFAFNPFTEQGIRDRRWKSLFTDLQKDFGIELDQDIWRFEFPRSLIQSRPEPTGRCLTGNAGFWKQNQLIGEWNIHTGGSYSLSVDGDSVSDENQTNPFSSGKLTDRQRAWAAMADTVVLTSNISDHIVRYDKPESISIIFDFTRPYPLTRANVFYSGRVPAMSVFVSDDGDTWRSLSKVTGNLKTTEDVLELTASGNWGNHRYLKLLLDARNPGEQLTLTEVEVWAR